MVGKVVSFWEGLFSGAMWKNFGRVMTSPHRSVSPTQPNMPEDIHRTHEFLPTLGWPDGPGHDQETGSFFNGTKPRRPATRWIEKSIDWSFFRRCFESIFFWQKICQVWSGPWEVIASGKPYLFPKRFSQCLSRIWLSPCHNTCSTYAVVNKHINGN